MLVESRERKREAEILTRLHLTSARRRLKAEPEASGRISVKGSRRWIRLRNFDGKGVIRPEHFRAKAGWRG
jgi:hypothetical protein